MKVEKPRETKKDKFARLTKYFKNREKVLADKGKKKPKKSTGFELLESDPNRKMRNDR
ncbi:Uncharacterised protein [uncultured archaeon]|nr:Uncharacterised protein [uncultured archaeon]